MCNVHCALCTDQSHNATHWLISNSNANLIHSVRVCVCVSFALFSSFSRHIYISLKLFNSFEWRSLFAMKWFKYASYFYKSFEMFFRTRVRNRIEKVVWECVCVSFFRLYFQFPFIMSSVERRLVTNNLDRFPEISDHNWSYMAFSV